MYGNDSDDFDPAEILWSPGVDYVGAWRDAENARADLLSALTAAWPDAHDITAVTRSTADGSAQVQLRAPAATARKLAALIRAAAPGGAARREAS